MHWVLSSCPASEKGIPGTAAGSTAWAGASGQLPTEAGSSRWPCWGSRLCVCSWAPAESAGNNTSENKLSYERNVRFTTSHEVQDVSSLARHAAPHPRWAGSTWQDRVAAVSAALQAQLPLRDCERLPIGLCPQEQGYSCKGLQWQGAPCTTSKQSGPDMPERACMTVSCSCIRTVTVDHCRPSGFDGALCCRSACTAGRCSCMHAHLPPVAAQHRHGAR